MTRAIYLAKETNKSGKAISYMLANENNIKQRKLFTADELKSLIRNGQIEVVNLQMDKLGRLREEFKKGTFKKGTFCRK